MAISQAVAEFPRISSARAAIFVFQVVNARGCIDGEEVDWFAGLASVHGGLARVADGGGDSAFIGRKAYPTIPCWLQGW